LLRTCLGDGGLYVVAGRKSIVPILSILRTPWKICCIPERRECKCVRCDDQR